MILPSIKAIMWAVAICAAWLAAGQLLWATELLRLTPKNFESIHPQGKESDCIHGDWVLRNEYLVAAIAQPVPGRNANMTVRGVGGMLIDFVPRGSQSDQLGCFYPGGGRYSFEKPVSVTCTSDSKIVSLETQERVEGRAISLSLVGKAINGDGTSARLTYTLRDGALALQYRVELTNESTEPRKLKAQDSIRCDGRTFKFGKTPVFGAEDLEQLFWAEDRFFCQSYGIKLEQGVIEQAEDKRTLAVVRSDLKDQPLPPKAWIEWSGNILCSQGLPGLHQVAAALPDNRPTQPYQLKLVSPQGPIQHAEVEYFRNGSSLGVVNTDDQGQIRMRLTPGEYSLKAVAIGREPRENNFVISNAPVAETLSLPAASRIEGRITDGEGKPIFAKIQLIGVDGSNSPDFGPDSGDFRVKNVIYSEKGRFMAEISPGKYTAIISHGPEYDADTQSIEVMPNQALHLRSSLKRSVDTRGWISAEFHSHSSPSGDNVSSQLGRVLNLLAEHLEFCPCTEHNRIDSYDDELLRLQATRDMATCTGIELTGSPLPINHQNAFPLHRHPHTQDGGGPTTLVDPVAQIERLSLWDSQAAKLVQTNHPNIPQMLGDRDLNGQADEGFRGMFGFMDVIEVHPPEGIFSMPAVDLPPKDRVANPIFHWLQLLNLGYRIPGVVNTDAHYNFHGSGWLRNYLLSQHDSPAEIDVSEIVHAAEHGHVIMSTGPFLQAELRVEANGIVNKYISGDDVPIGNQPSKLWMRVQCPNWMDINRVQVFLSGRASSEFNFTRKSQPGLFSDNAVRFEHTLSLPAFVKDTHIIVAAIGEGLKIDQIMGAERAQTPPVAVANPIFLDVDGSGFQPNGDDLGVPFMLPKAGGK